SEIVIATRMGMACRFHETAVRSMGRFTSGVKGITLNADDTVVGVETPRPGADLLTVCENGYGKRSKVDDYRLTNRGGKGVINIKATERNGKVVAIKEVIDEDELIMITREGMSIRSRVADTRTIGRNTQGVRLINLQADDKVVGVARLAEKEDDDDELEAGEVMDGAEGALEEGADGDKAEGEADSDEE